MGFTSRGYGLAAVLVLVMVAAPAASARVDTGARTVYPPVERSVPWVAPPPSSIAASEGRRYEALRRPAATDDAPPAAVPKPVVTEAPRDFDWFSAAVGAAIAAGLSLLAVAAAGLRRQRTARVAA
jgi:hypothetical protein